MRSVTRHVLVFSGALWILAGCDPGPLQRDGLHGRLPTSSTVEVSKAQFRRWLSLPGTVSSLSCDVVLPALEARRLSRGVHGVDLGIPLGLSGKQFYFFGDTHYGQVGSTTRIRDGYPLSVGLQSGTSLWSAADFAHDSTGFVRWPSLGPDPRLWFKGPLEVPTGALVDHEADGSKAYIFMNVESSPEEHRMERVVLARWSGDPGHLHLSCAVPGDKAGCPLSTWSNLGRSSVPGLLARNVRFTNVAPIVVDASQFPSLPAAFRGDADGQHPVAVVFGTGADGPWRHSDVYLAVIDLQRLRWQHLRAGVPLLDQLDMRYFAGRDAGGKALWSASDTAAAPVFSVPYQEDRATSGSGEFSATYLPFPQRQWVVLYRETPESGGPVFVLRVASSPTGPFSAPKPMLTRQQARTDGLFDCYCGVNGQCSADRGTLYAPYINPALTRMQESNRWSLVFAASLWHPYEVVLLESSLRFPAPSWHTGAATFHNVAITKTGAKALASNGSALSTVRRYAEGPCQYASSDRPCELDTRTVFHKGGAEDREHHRLRALLQLRGQ